eukprot:2916689-Amphidinium_carterae.1
MRLNALPHPSVSRWVRGSGRKQDLEDAIEQNVTHLTVPPQASDIKNVPETVGQLEKTCRVEHPRDLA